MISKAKKGIPVIYKFIRPKNYKVATDDFASLVQSSGGALKPSKYCAYFPCYHATNGKTMLKLLKKIPDALAFVVAK